MMVRAALTVLVTIYLCSSTAAAQWPSDLRPGTRIQVMLPEAEFQNRGPRGHFLRGRLESIGTDSLHVRITDSLPAVAVPHTLIRRLYISRGVPGRLENGLRTGLFWGVLYGVTTAVLMELGNSDGRSTGEALAVGGSIGFGTGFVFGTIFPIERWGRVRPDRTTAPASTQGVQLGVTLTW